METGNRTRSSLVAALLVPLAAHGLDALLSSAQKRLSRMRARA